MSLTAEQLERAERNKARAKLLLEERLRRESMQSSSSSSSQRIVSALSLDPEAAGGFVGESVARLDDRVVPENRPAKRPKAETAVGSEVDSTEASVCEVCHLTDPGRIATNLKASFGVCGNLINGYNYN